MSLLLLLLSSRNQLTDKQADRQSQSLMLSDSSCSGRSGSSGSTKRRNSYMSANKYSLNSQRLGKNNSNKLTTTNVGDATSCGKNNCTKMFNEARRQQEAAAITTTSTNTTIIGTKEWGTTKQKWARGKNCEQSRKMRDDFHETTDGRVDELAYALKPLRRRRCCELWRLLKLERVASCVACNKRCISFVFRFYFLFLKFLTLLLLFLIFFSGFLHCCWRSFCCSYSPRAGICFLFICILNTVAVLLFFCCCCSYCYIDELSSSRTSRMCLLPAVAPPTVRHSATASIGNRLWQVISAASFTQPAKASANNLRLTPNSAPCAL